MSFIEKSYSGKVFRPRPEILIENNLDLVIIATPWGPRSSAKKAIQVIRDYFLSSQQDEEATSPFSRLTCLSPLANDLRIAVKLANDTLYNEDNKNEYISGVELFVTARRLQEVAWIQIGYPFVLLNRPQRPLTPFGSQLDMSIEFSLSAKTLSPLPCKMLGLENNSDFSIESFRPNLNDQFVLVSRSGVPSEIFGLPAAERNLDKISHLLSKNDPSLPFWLGILNLTAS
ncbi:MAG: hypothetical protein A2Z20_03865 [Bdellovibrionales bacterium RBG_16_40_8]|nr:MAG: hypothetical protein A2Z20_03865 [Bdellovibrionales bacterium RBG_16_40_8]